MTLPIPPMTHPLSSAWDQPRREEVLVDDTHALMSQAAWDALHEYSASIPSGAYEGKMWKRHDGLHDLHCRPQDRRWLFAWYGECDKPDHVSINYRAVIIL